ncbi:hypothetical protein [Kribbella sp. CA-293567]|uniref:hypothetical protein n=1 Tax=Kribbella sp. CA-293567 TaxID=3002436 RepID=UPI0022DE4850|nr:hypothetical protein [Kribbella sp. CA-293567]WBQ08192.1 hypothetical protein OX958_15620 [Kribbella sp. CA-293567]
MENEASWRERRRDASIEQAAALDRRRAAETAKARELLAAFIEELKRRGVEPGPLRAPVVGTGANYRTGLTGWYLRRNRSLAVDVEGNFYILGTPAGLRAWLFGVTVLPTDPPLVVGRGARDGESLPLAELLQARLDEAAPEG